MSVMYNIIYVMCINIYIYTHYIYIYTHVTIFIIVCNYMLICIHLFLCLFITYMQMGIIGIFPSTSKNPGILQDGHRGRLAPALWYLQTRRRGTGAGCSGVPWDPWSVESRWIGQDGLRDVGDVASLCLFSVKSVAAEFLAIYHLNVFRHNGISVKAWYFAHNIAPSAARDICL